MAHTLTLEVSQREMLGTKKLHKLRRQGLLPGVVYGYKVASGVPVQVDHRTFEHLYRRVGATTLIDLRIGDKGIATKVFVHEVMRHPVNHRLLHVDFKAVNMNEPITADVSIVITGEAPVTRAGDGIVSQLMDTLHVRALPANLPGNIEVDLSVLTEVGQAIHVSDLTLPADVEVLSDPDAAIVHVTAMQKTEEEEEAEAEAAAEEAAEADEADES
jgi:large subunit ribosomal protein L25